MEASTEGNSERETQSPPIEESQPQPEEVSEEKTSPPEDNASESKVESTPEPSEAPALTVESEAPPKEANNEDIHHTKKIASGVTVAQPGSNESDVKPKAPEDVQTSVSAAALAAARDEWAQLENSQRPGND